tara:strand:- start:649 stop:1017 length:369 start_codon:yes stop_codon:yes gene_type:complete
MFKWITKQFLYGKIYNWVKERLSGLLLAIILLILVFYIHNEYLNYVEYENKELGNYIGLSFIIKNILILGIVFGYLYFYRTINQTKQSIKHTKQVIKKESKHDDKEKVKSLDEFMSDDEIDR